MANTSSSFEDLITSHGPVQTFILNNLIPTDKVIRHAILNDLGQPQRVLSTGDWDLVAKPRAELPVNDVDDDGLFHQTDTDKQMGEIPRNNPVGEIILNNLQHVQSSLSFAGRSSNR